MWTAFYLLFPELGGVIVGQSRHFAVTASKAPAALPPGPGGAVV